MASFWQDIARRTGKHFDLGVRWWVSWIGIVLLLVGIYWIDRVDVIRRQWLGSIIAAVIVVYVVVAVKRALEERDAELQDRIAALAPDERIRNGRIADDLDNMLDTANLVALDIRRTYLPQQHPQQIANWVGNIETYLRQSAPRYLNRFRQPMPLHPRHPNVPDGDGAHWDLSERIQRVQAIIDDLRNN